MDTELPDDEDWMRVPEGPPYFLIESDDYHSFLEIIVRDVGVNSNVPLADASVRVERLTVTVIGERETVAYGLTEEASLSREETVKHVGADGWQKLVLDAKITATTFVLIGGQFEHILCRQDPSAFFSATNGSITTLVPDVQATMLVADFLASDRVPTGILADVCEERDLLADIDPLILTGDQDDGDKFGEPEDDLNVQYTADTLAVEEVEDTVLEAPPQPVAEPVDAVPAPVRELRRKLSRLILTKGATERVGVLLEELRQLEKKHLEMGVSPAGGA
jgi:hypothetical protein